VRLDSLLSLEPGVGGRGLGGLGFSGPRRNVCDAYPNDEFERLKVWSNGGSGGGSFVFVPLLKALRREAKEGFLEKDGVFDVAMED
jgi:hypothetical protein